MLDLMSFLLGLLAWWIPIRAMLPRHRHKGFHYVIFSLGACTFSIQFQVMKVIFSLYSGGGTMEEERFSFLFYSLGTMILGTAIFLLLSIYVKNKK